MIEIKNLKAYTCPKDRLARKFHRTSIVSTNILGVTVSDYCDEDGDYIVNIFRQHLHNTTFCADSSEKAHAFYDALMALLPDSADKKQTIDAKDFE